VNPTFDLRLRYGGNHSAPSGTRSLETIGLSGNGILADDVDHLTFRIAVNRSRLDGADPETVTLYRSNGTGWVPLRTTRVNATADGTTNATDAANDTLVYETRTTDLSTLLVAVEEPRPPAESAANATGTATATATASATAAPTVTSTATPAASTARPTGTAGSAPGFGPLIAVLAVLLAATASARGRR
jgi:hypothetical protein